MRKTIVVLLVLALLIPMLVSASTPTITFDLTNAPRAVRVTAPQWCIVYPDGWRLCWRGARNVPPCDPETGLPPGRYTQCFVPYSTGGR